MAAAAAVQNTWRKLTLKCDEAYLILIQEGYPESVARAMIQHYYRHSVATITKDAPRNEPVCFASGIGHFNVSVFRVSSVPWWHVHGPLPELVIPPGLKSVSNISFPN